MPRANLLTAETKVEAPFVRVKIGSGEHSYTFGVYEGRTRTINTDNGVITALGIKYKSAKQDMINGTIITTIFTAFMVYMAFFMNR